jgi:hypothetical protein
MMRFFGVYTLITVLIVIMLAAHNHFLNKKSNIAEYDRPILELYSIVFAVLWPFTLFGILVLESASRHRHYIQNKVSKHVKMAESDYSYLYGLSSKLLKLIKHADSINAINLSDNIKTHLEKSIVSREFEDNLLRGSND